MTQKRDRNWPVILEQAKQLAPTCSSIAALSRLLELPASTLKDAMRRLQVTRVSLGLGIELQRLDEEAGRNVTTATEGRNRMTISYKGPRIVNPDQLLEFCEIDLEVWEVNHFIVNKWEVGAKPVMRDLKWHRGVMSGIVQSSGGLVVEPLFQVKLWMKRIEPLAQFPTVQPINVTTPVIHPPAPIGGRVRRAMVWGDAHFGFKRNIRTGVLQPFHKRAALDLILQLAEAAEVDEVHILGDLLDLPDWSDKFLRSPEVLECLQPALLECHWWLAQFAQLAPTSIHQGNHELRFDNAILKHLRAAYDVRAADEMELPPALSVQRLLALHQIGVKWIGDYPADFQDLNLKLRLLHGKTYRSAPGATAQAVAKESDGTQVFGHIHRVEWVTVSRRDENDTVYPVVGFSPGCACHLDGRVPGQKRPNWQNGCAIIEYEVGGTLFSIAPFLFADDHVIFQGDLLCAGDDDVLRAVEQTPSWTWATEK